MTMIEEFESDLDSSFTDEKGRIFNRKDFVYFVGSHNKIPKNIPLEVMGIQHHSHIGTSIFVTDGSRHMFSPCKDFMTKREIIKEML